MVAHNMGVRLALLERTHSLPEIDNASGMPSDANEHEWAAHDLLEPLEFYRWVERGWDSQAGGEIE